MIDGDNCNTYTRRRPTFPAHRAVPIELPDAKDQQFKFTEAISLMLQVKKIDIAALERAAENR
ncbi:MAG TPA: hypothetical protein VF980_07870 [Thermoanaerobaculia bacterium]